MDQYIKILNEVCEGLEKVYGVAIVSETEKALLDEDIQVVLEEVKTQISEIGSKGVSERNSQAFDLISLLSHVMYRMDFFEYSKLSFKGFPHLEDIDRALKPFSTRKALNKESVKYVNLVVSVLDIIYRKYINLRFELQYRLLRIFTILVMYRNYAEASILANFILKQIRRGGSAYKRYRSLDTEDKVF
jgi:hypothetical protein